MKVFYKLIMALLIYRIVSYETMMIDVHFENYIPFKYLEEKDVSNSLNLKDNLPSINASVGFFPFSSKLVEKIYDEESYDGELNFKSTPQSFQSVIEGKTDIAIASDTHKIQRDYINSLGDEIITVPIAKDALVFYVNSKTGVDNLTIDNIQQIYNGNIANWNQLRGQ